MFERWKKRREAERMARYITHPRDARRMDGDVPSYWGQVGRILLFDALVLAGLVHALMRLGVVPPLNG
ncbi:hypothetical protein E7811_17135 [Aliigemmobacter aestuarii]|uniref:Uncharacterized protein n=1 Tax=Aliigemmobacter aestuarii TaxID=1445661 RepID=A0A4S3MIS7_9RHOB|nr:hypothetical protein [Gemmobacter aestuarii]THD81192.1 hypothetical protein E7811_17135 [Gemmobacter aestuarii]